MNLLHIRRKPNRISSDLEVVSMKTSNLCKAKVKTYKNLSFENMNKHGRSRVFPRSGESIVDLSFFEDTKGIWNVNLHQYL